MPGTPPASEPFLALFSLPCWALIADAFMAVLAVAAVALTVYLWRAEGDARSRQQTGESDDDFRSRKEIGQNGVVAQLNAGLTSASVLLAGAFALLGFASDARIPFTVAARTQVVIGTIWLLLSIFAGVWNSGIISPKSPRQDVSRVPSVHVILSIQLWSILLGGVSVLLSLFLTH